jgi:DNA polymerase III sliding clamp (beta) subunit (PCNA family)
MKFPKLDLVCSNDDLRPAFSHVKVEKEFTFATDAHVLVRHNTSELFDESFLLSIPEEGLMIPKRAISLMRKNVTTNISLSDDKKMIQLYQKDGSIISYRCSIQEKFPDANKLFPKKEDTKPLNEIVLSAYLLYNLAQAMGCETPILHLRFYEPTKAILVTPNQNSDYFSVIGIIMPAIIQD